LGAGHGRIAHVSQHKMQTAVRTEARAASPRTWTHLRAATGMRRSEGSLLVGMREVVAAEAGWWNKWRKISMVSISDRWLA
jgi:hypothetical protein